MAKAAKKAKPKEPIVTGSFDDVISASVSGIGAAPKPGKKPKSKKK